MRSMLDTLDATRRLVLAAALASTTLLAAGCRPAICQRMVECCEQLRDDPKVGRSCGDVASDVADPETCRTVLETVGYMFEQRDGSPPKACRLNRGGD